MTITQNLLATELIGHGIDDVFDEIDEHIKSVEQVMVFKDDREGRIACLKSVKMSLEKLEEKHLEEMAAHYEQPNVGHIPGYKAPSLPTQEERPASQQARH